jgi:hypothetical protein
MSDDLAQYPRGAVAMGNGDLIQVTNVKLKLSNGAKLKHTLRKSPSGFVLGHLECSGSMEIEIPETGAEKDYWTMVQNGDVNQIRLKLPADTRAVNIVASSMDLELPSDDAIKQTVEFVGEVVDT